MLLLGANASGDFKLMPMILYYSEYLWTFTTKKLSQMNWKWKSNHKAWMTRKMFIKLAFLVLLFCGLVVRVSGYRYRGLGFDSRRYQIF